MAAIIDCVRACILAVVILGTVAAGTAGVALWDATAAQPEAHTWIRIGAQGCRYVPVGQAIGAPPCQS